MTYKIHCDVLVSMNPLFRADALFQQMSYNLQGVQVPGRVYWRSFCSDHKDLWHMYWSILLEDFTWGSKRVSVYANVIYIWASASIFWQHYYAMDDIWLVSLFIKLKCWTSECLSVVVFPLYLHLWGHLRCRFPHREFFYSLNKIVLLHRCWKLKILTFSIEELRYTMQRQTLTNID